MTENNIITRGKCRNLVDPIEQKTIEERLFGLEMLVSLYKYSDNDFDVIIHDALDPYDLPYHGNYRFMCQISRRNLNGSCKLKVSKIYQMIKKSIFKQQQRDKIEYVPSFSIKKDLRTPKSKVKAKQKQKKGRKLGDTDYVSLSIKYPKKIKKPKPGRKRNLFVLKKQDFVFVSIPRYSLSELSDDCVAQIFLFLDFKFLMKRMSIVNRRVNEIVECDYLYEHNYFPFLLEKKNVWIEKSTELKKPAEIPWKTFLRASFGSTPSQSTTRTSPNDFFVDHHKVEVKTSYRTDENGRRNRVYTFSMRDPIEYVRYLRDGVFSEYEEEERTIWRSGGHDFSNRYVPCYEPSSSGIEKKQKNQFRNINKRVKHNQSKNTRKHRSNWKGNNKKDFRSFF